MLCLIRKVNRNVIGVRGTKKYRSFMLALVKREAGVIPARTRRCNEGALFRK